MSNDFSFQIFGAIYWNAFCHPTRRQETFGQIKIKFYLCFIRTSKRNILRFAQYLFLSAKKKSGWVEIEIRYWAYKLQQKKHFWSLSFCCRKFWHSLYLGFIITILSSRYAMFVRSIIIILIFIITIIITIRYNDCLKAWVWSWLGFCSDEDLWAWQGAHNKYFSQIKMMIAMQASHNVKFFLSIIIFLKDCKRYDDNWLIAKDSDDDDEMMGSLKGSHNILMV